MSGMPLFTPKFVREFALELGLQKHDLVVASRQNALGGDTFALGVNYGGSQFPEWVWTDSPLSNSGFGSIRSACQDALDAKRHLENHGITVELDQPGKWDEDDLDYSKGRRSVADTIGRLAVLGQLLPEDASFNQKTLAYFLREDEDPDEVAHRLAKQDAENYSRELGCAYKRLGIEVTIDIDALNISSSTTWEEIWGNIWKQIHPQLRS